MNPLRKILSYDLFERGKDLSNFGIDEYAWNKNDIEIIISILSKKKIGILGGDVYKEYNDTIEMTYDNWFVNDDGKPDFYQKSQKIALNYIFEYEKNNRGSFLYSITISA